MRKHKGSAIALVVILMFGCLTFMSCKKNGPTVAIITVLDTLGRVVSGASVTLWQDTSHSTQTGLPGIIRVTKTTDVSGKASFEFQLEAYLNIEAVKDSLIATGIVHLKEHETVNETVQF